MNKKTQKDLNIQKFTLNNYKLKNGVAYLKWKHKDQQKLNIKPEDCAKVNLISNIENSGAWIFFIEYKEKNFIRIEFRSSGLPVNEIAKKFGGGGHQRASGAKINIDWNLTNKIIEETQKQLKIYNKKNKLD
jgi:phosphoesterase RecJ-like protein